MTDRADPAPSVRHVIQYVQLKPGQTAPPKAVVKQAPAPPPRVVVVTTTRQSGGSRDRAGPRSGRGPTEPAVAAAARPRGRSTGPRLRQRPMLGGHVGIHLATPSDRADAESRPGVTPTDCSIGWRRGQARLTRFSAASDLVRLNAGRRERVPVRPTLAAVIDWGREAEGLSDGIVDIALLDARLEAESSARAADRAPSSRPGLRRWSMARGPRGRTCSGRSGLPFDLDGVAKGWLADRAARRLAALPDRRRRCRRRHRDPARPGPTDAVRRGRPADAGRRSLSSSSWRDRGRRRRGVRPRDVRDVRPPLDGRRAGRRTISSIPGPVGRPATDLVQATVLAGSAREAEAIAKTAVIVGSESALERPRSRRASSARSSCTDRATSSSTPSTMALAGMKFRGLDARTQVDPLGPVRRRHRHRRRRDRRRPPSRALAGAWETQPRRACHGSSSAALAFLAYGALSRAR